MSEYNKDLLWFIALVVVMVCVLSLIGCATWPSGNNPSPTHEDMLKQVVYKTNWMNTLCILGIGFGVVAFINGNKIGMGVVIGSAVALWANITLIRYAHIMAFFGMGAGLLLTGYTIYLKRKALIEIVHSVERVKVNSNGEAPAINKILGSVQSATTRQVVDNIKKLIGPLTEENDENLKR